MAIIKSYSPYLNLSNFSTFIVDRNPNSDYFRINEFKEVFSGGKNGFLIAGSEFLKETTEVKIEILDVEGNPVYFEPGDGTPEYYEGLSTLVSVHVYPDTPIGLGKITILGELKNYVNQDGTILPIPEEWKGVYNVKWERTFNINRNLANEDIVRFYRRPSVTITELVKPIFSKTIPSVTQSGSVEGIAIQPIQNANLSNWTAGTLYKLKITDGTNWTSSIDDNIIDIPSLGYSPTVIEVLNNKEVLVDVPYAENNIVKNFSSASYTSSFEYVEGQTVTTSILTGSFAKINISNLKTFVGDVARVKVFRKSRNEVTDYQFVQESKLESSELLRDITVSSDTEISYGNFNQTNLATYWTSSNSNHPLSINVDVLQSSVKCDYNTSIGGVQNLITTESFSISKDVEYTLTFKTLLSGSIDGSEYIKAYFSSSDGYQQTFLTISGSSIYKTRQNVSQNIIASPISTSDAKLVFEIKGSDWYISNVSLKNAQETSFSPDEFVLVQDIQRKLATETFDFKFEFYDINNNYIPVDVTATGIFDGGNEYPTNTKILLLEGDRSSFRFTTGSIGNPPFQQIGFTTTRQNIVDDVTYDRSVFDITGSYISEAQYLALGGIEYPGRLHTSSSAGFVVQIDEFTGSLDTATSNLFRVGFIVYTASADGLQEYETIYRLEDGDNAPGIFASSTSNQFIYKATDLSLNPIGQIISFDVRRKNLGTSGAPITIDSISQTGSSYPLTLLFDDPTTGVATYYLSGSDYKFTSGSTTFFFSASDNYGIDYHDQITITPIKILDGFSVNVSNENTTFPAYSTGTVFGGFAASSGSINVKIGNENISYSSAFPNNSFSASISSFSGLTPNTFNGTNYSINALSADSGSLTLLVKYKDGGGTIISSSKDITYSKSKKAAPILNLVVGNNNQSVTAKSTGVQIDSFLTSSLSVFETYDGVTTTKSISQLNTSASNAYTFTSSSSEIRLPVLSSGLTSTDIFITASVTDSEGTSRNLFGNISLAKVNKSVPNVLVSATPQSQNVGANAGGTQSGTLSNVVVSALEGNSSVFVSMSVVTSSGFDSTPTITTNTLNLSSRTLTSSEASVTLLVSYTDSEGTSGNQNIIVRATKTNSGASGVSINITPSSQIVNVSTAGVYSTSSQFTVQVIENGTPLQYISGSTPTTSKFTISSLIDGTITGSNGATSIKITPTTPSTTAGITTTFSVSYRDSSGTLSSPISQSHIVSVGLDGVTGPGVVHTGTWEVGRAYQFESGLLTGTGRRDTVLWSSNGNPPYDTYYAATRAHTSTNNSNALTGRPDLGGPWVSLGTQDFFVAAKIAVFEDSFIQNTLNIGTSNNGGISSANITLNGSDVYPYFSLGQAATAGSQEYGVNGIFIGRHDVTKNTDASNGAYVMSLVNGSTAWMKWNGSSLDIKGSITVTGGDAATNSNLSSSLQNAVTSGSVSASAAQTAAQLFAQTAANNAIATGSISASAAQTNAVTQANTNALNFASASVNMLANGGWIGGSGTFITATSISSPLIAGNGGYISGLFRVGQNGITLDGINKKIYVGAGNYYNSDTPFYFASGSSNVFSLGNKLGFDGSNLTITGNITANTGSFTGTVNAAGGTFTGNITATGTITGGTITGGTLTGATGDFNGSVTANDGAIGGWTIVPGKISSANGTVNLLSGGDGSIYLNRTGTVTPAVLINGGGSFANYSTGTALSTTTLYSTAEGLDSGPDMVVNAPITSVQETWRKGSSGVSSGNVGNGIVTFEVTAGKTYSVVVTNLNYGTTHVAARWNGFGSIFRLSNDCTVRLVGAGAASTNLGGSGWPSTGTSRTIVDAAGSTLYSGGGYDSYFAEAGFVKYGTFTATVTERIHVFLESELRIYGDDDARLTDFRFAPTSIQVSEVASYSELNGAGFQTGETSTKYIRVRREASNEGGTGTTTMLEVGGAISCTGDVVANTSSDLKLKENIRKIPNPIEKIKQLSGNLFEWKEGYNQSSLESRTDYGVIAQEVEKVMPEIVFNRPTGFKGVRYDKIIPLLIEAIKEQQKEIEELKNSR